MRELDERLGFGALITLHLTDLAAGEEHAAAASGRPPESIYTGSSVAPESKR